jgi:predicted dehydrogenase
MTMPTPRDDDPRWPLELAGGALMDLRCYGLHVVRMFEHLAGGAPEITSATAVQCTPGVDEICDVELAFPGGATGYTSGSMVSDEYRFTTHAIGTDGDALVHDFIKPNDDDRVTIRTAGAPERRSSAPGRRTPVNWKRWPRTSCSALNCRSASPTPCRT